MKPMSLIVSDLHTMDRLYERVIERLPVGIGIFEIPGIETSRSVTQKGLSVSLRLIDGNPRFYSFFSTKRATALGNDLRTLVERAFPSDPSVHVFLHVLSEAVKNEEDEKIVMALGATIRILVLPGCVGALLIEGSPSSPIQP